MKLMKEYSFEYHFKLESNTPIRIGLPLYCISYVFTPDYGSNI